MKREEIIKALDCHASKPKYRDCVGCYFETKGLCEQNCTEGLADVALALIKELTEENKKITINMNAYGLTAKRLSEEKERLLAACTELTQCCTKFETLYKIECKRVDTIYAATVREMQTRLTNLFANDENLEYIEVDAEYINEQIDQIANEMIGETK